MVHPTPHRLTAVLLAVIIGGPWAVLQSVAWVGMFVGNLREVSLDEALARTLDGRHPCKLCRVVETGREAESKAPQLKVDTKIDLLLTRVVVTCFVPLGITSPMPPSALPPARAVDPPTPPPRSA